jgi:hypothetical protein
MILKKAEFFDLPATLRLENAPRLHLPHKCSRLRYRIAPVHLCRIPGLSIFSSHTGLEQRRCYLLRNKALRVG